MPDILSNTMLMFIIGAAGCVVIGAVITAIRVSNFFRRERAKENEVKAQLMMEARAVKKDTEATPG